MLLHVHELHRVEMDDRAPVTFIRCAAGKSLRDFCFMFGGAKVRASDTPEGVGLKDGHTVEAMQSQAGF